MAVGARVDRRVMITPTDALKAGRPVWRALFGYEDAINDVDLRGDRLYAISTKDEPRGQVISWRIGADGRLSDRRLMHEDAGQSFTGLVAARDALFVTGTRDGRTSVRFIAWRHGVPHELALPFDGAR